MPSSQPLRIAHRGMPLAALENTLDSFRRALDAGADGLEVDVHATADGEIVLHHDAVLANGGAIATSTLDELRRHELAPGVSIPTLAELCALVAGRATLFVELKGAGIERQVLRALSAYGGAVAMHSFDHAMITRVARIDPSRRLGLLFEHAPVTVALAMGETGALDVWPHWPLVTAALIAEVHEAGGRVIPWTVNDERLARAFAALGVDGLCGDDVGRLVIE